MVIWLVYPVVGILAGLMAGLFGIGGGLVIVPILTFVLVWQGIPDNIIPHAAIATSLMTITFTAFSSAKAHLKQGTADWLLVKKVLPGILVGSVCGALLATSISGHWLIILFGLFLIVMAVWAYFPDAQTVSPKLVTLPFALPITVVIGSVAVMLGIGGGGFIVPYLVMTGQTMQRAIGSAAVAIFPMAVLGAATYIISGHFIQQINVPWMTGYIYWPAFIGIILTSVWAAPFGARLAKRLNNKLMARLFSVLLLIVGISMLVHR